MGQEKKGHLWRGTRIQSTSPKQQKTISSCLREAEVASLSADPAKTAAQADNVIAALGELPVSHAHSLLSYRD